MSGVFSFSARALRRSPLLSSTPHDGTKLSSITSPVKVERDWSSPIQKLVLQAQIDLYSDDINTIFNITSSRLISKDQEQPKRIKIL